MSNAHHALRAREAWATLADYLEGAADLTEEQCAAADVLHAALLPAREPDSLRGTLVIVADEHGWPAAGIVATDAGEDPKGCDRWRVLLEHQGEIIARAEDCMVFDAERIENLHERLREDRRED